MIIFSFPKNRIWLVSWTLYSFDQNHFWGHQIHQPRKHGVKKSAFFWAGQPTLSGLIKGFLTSWFPLSKALSNPVSLNQNIEIDEFSLSFLIHVNNRTCTYVCKYRDKGRISKSMIHLWSGKLMIFESLTLATFREITSLSNHHQTDAFKPIWATCKTSINSSYIPLYWLVCRDPHNGFLWLIIIPINLGSISSPICSIFTRVNWSLPI